MTKDEPWQDPKSPQDARLASLDERLSKAQAEEAVRTGKPGHDLKIYRDQVDGSKVLTVLIGFPIGSALIGYVIDRMVGTHVIWVAMLFVGFGLAMWEVWKLAQASSDRAQGKSESGSDR